MKTNAWAVIHPSAEYPLVMDGSSQYEIFHDKKVAEACKEANCECRVVRVEIQLKSKKNL